MSFKGKSKIIPSLSFQGIIVYWPWLFEYELWFNGIQLFFCRSVSVECLRPSALHEPVAFLFHLSFLVLFSFYKCVPTSLKLPKNSFYTNTITYFSEILLLTVNNFSVSFQTCCVSVWCRKGVMAGSCKGECPWLILQLYSNIGLFDVTINVPPSSFNGAWHLLCLCN